MSGSEFNDCLHALGLSAYQFAELVDIDYKTINKRGNNVSRVPNEAAILVRVLTARPELLPLAWKFAGLPDGGERKSRNISKID